MPTVGESLRVRIRWSSLGCGPSGGEADAVLQLNVSRGSVYRVLAEKCLSYKLVTNKI